MVLSYHRLKRQYVHKDQSGNDLQGPKGNLFTKAQRAHQLPRPKGPYCYQDQKGQKITSVRRATQRLSEGASNKIHPEDSFMIVYAYIYQPLRRQPIALFRYRVFQGFAIWWYLHFEELFEIDCKKIRKFSFENSKLFLPETFP